MRVYKRGVLIPMDKLTWDDMCSPCTYTNWDEDPDVDFPEAVKQGMREAPYRIAVALRAKPSLIQRLKKLAFGDRQ